MPETSAESRSNRHSPLPAETTSGNAPAAAESPAPAVVVLMNHDRDDLGDVAQALARNGYAVHVADSLAQSHRLLQSVRPDLVVLNPLVLSADGVEAEWLGSLQRDDDPVPVILLVDDLQALSEARALRLPFRDFVLKPCTPTECVYRAELALQTRSNLRRLHQRTRVLESQVSEDFKTGLVSERHMRTLLDREWKRAQRYQNPLSLLLIDVDDFKSVNDSTEYAFGDEVLRRVADSLRTNVRETDFASRFGGDEFCVLLPQTTPGEAVQTAMRIKQRIAAMPVQKGSFHRTVTVSIGIDSYDGRAASSVDQLRRNANRALQEAKRRGKNQVWLWPGGDAAG